jgi:hypothetical protein
MQCSNLDILPSTVIYLDRESQSIIFDSTLHVHTVWKDSSDASVLYPFSALSGLISTPEDAKRDVTPRPSEE